MSEAKRDETTEPAESPTETSPTAPTAKSKAKAKAEEPESAESILTTIGTALLIAIFVRIVFFELFEIDGPSMERSLLHGDRVFVTKCLYGLWIPGMDHAVVNWGHPELGDVIILNSPMDGADLVKRVIGLPGDTIEVREGIVYRNGTAIPQRDVGPCEDDEQRELDPHCHIYEERHGDHVYRTTRGSYGRDSMPTEVPAGHVYVLGDHRDHSNDSREPLVGPIPFARVKGKVLAVVSSGFITRGEIRWNRFFMGVD